MRELQHQLQTAESALRGANVALTHNLENWERKEFEAVKKQAENKITEVNEIIKICMD
tara:strand:- start:484 stop:657 length:174 start_codon:yes stop_codon:yes gene_type:complete